MSGATAQSCNSGTREEDHEFEAGLRYIVRTLSQKTKQNTTSNWVFSRQFAFCAKLPYE
jgi:hypothetical protein